jgi:uncharacterized protein YbdZ (MbtH family)
MPHLTELRRILLSYAASHWATPHPNELRRISQATPHPTELRRISLSYATSHWATPHPTKLRRISLSYAAFHWAMPHLTELRRILLSYAASHWATPHPIELRHTTLRLTLLNHFLLSNAMKINGKIAKTRKSQFIQNYFKEKSNIWSAFSENVHF